MDQEHKISTPLDEGTGNENTSRNLQSNRPGEVYLAKLLS